MGGNNFFIVPMRRKSGFLRYWPLVIPLLVLLPFLGEFPFPGSGGDFTDLAITHFPNAVYLRRAILEFRTIPLWSSTILSGYPFFANPLSGLWYPPGWIALFFPLPFGFNLNTTLHLFWGSIGVYKLLKAEGCSERAALFGGIAFAGLPKLYAHYGAGHLTLLYAVVWTPWLLLASRREAEILKSVPPRQWWKHAGSRTGIILSLIVLADVRWLAYSVSVFVLYTLFQSFEYTFAGNLPQRVNHAYVRLRQFSSSLLRIFAAGTYTLLLAGPLILPLLEYVRISTRADMTSGDVFIYSLPVSRLLGLIFPDFGGFHEFMSYPGAAVLMLAFLGLVGGGINRWGKFWISLFFLSILYALGDSLPFIRFLADVPGFDLLRVPSRVLFITGLSILVLAAHSLDHLISGLMRSEVRRLNLGLTGLTGFVLMLTAAAWFATGSLPPNLAWGAGMILICSIWLREPVRNRIDQRYWYVGLIGIALMDWWVMDSSLFNTRSPENVLAEGSAAAAKIAVDEDFFRTYSPSYSLPQQTAAIYRLELADGIDPIQIASYREFLLRAAGIPDDGRYSVTLPPFPSGDPSVDNRAFVPDLELLGLLNVKYVISSFNFDTYPEDMQLMRADDVRIYSNPMYRPRAWVQESGDIFNGDYSSQVNLRWSPNRIAVKASGPGILVLSENAYPGWHVSVDGYAKEILTIAELLRGVEIPAGEHDIEFFFRPSSLYIGVAGLSFGLVLLVFTGWLSSRREDRNV